MIEDTVRHAIGDEMADAARRYQELLRSELLPFEVEATPRVYLACNASWTDCAVRYLVPVRSRRAWASRLLLAVSAELARPEHQGRVVGAYPRSEVRLQRSWGGGAPAQEPGTP